MPDIVVTTTHARAPESLPRYGSRRGETSEPCTFIDQKAKAAATTTAALVPTETRRKKTHTHIQITAERDFMCVYAVQALVERTRPHGSASLSIDFCGPREHAKI